MSAKEVQDTKVVSPLIPQTKIDKEASNCPLTAVAIGAILCVAGVFLTLAVHQVLPHGINAMSDLGIWGQIIGYGVLGIGMIVAIAGFVKWHLQKDNASSKNSKPQEVITAPILGDPSKSASSGIDSLKAIAKDLGVSLPELNSTVQISDDLSMQIATESLIIVGSKGKLGLVANRFSLRELAYHVQKNSTLVEQVMKCENSEDALKKLADAMRPKLAPDTIAGLCIVDSVHNTYSVEVFGNARVRVWEYNKVDDPGLNLTIYTQKEYEFSIAGNPDNKFFETRHHGTMPDNHCVGLRRYDWAGTVRLSYPVTAKS